MQFNEPCKVISTLEGILKTSTNFELLNKYGSQTNVITNSTPDHTILWKEYLLILCRLYLILISDKKHTMVDPGN